MYLIPYCLFLVNYSRVNSAVIIFWQTRCSSCSVQHFTSMSTCKRIPFLEIKRPIQWHNIFCHLKHVFIYIQQFLGKRSIVTVAVMKWKLIKMDELDRLSCSQDRKQLIFWLRHEVSEYRLAKRSSFVVRREANYYYIHLSIIYNEFETHKNSVEK